MKFYIFLISIVLFANAKNNYYYENNQKVFITPVYSVLRSDSKIDYYQNNQGIVLGVTDKLIIKLKDNEKLEQILSEFNLTFEKTLSKNIYLLRTSNKNLIIDISNRLSEKEYVKYAHPDFVEKMMSR